MKKNINIHTKYVFANYTFRSSILSYVLVFAAFVETIDMGELRKYIPPFVSVLLAALFTFSGIQWVEELKFGQNKSHTRSRSNQRTERKKNTVNAMRDSRGNPSTKRTVHSVDLVRSTGKAYVGYVEVGIHVWCVWCNHLLTACISRPRKYLSCSIL